MSNDKTKEDINTQKTRKEQNKTNEEETYDSFGLLRDIQSRQCEMLEKLGEMTITIKDIEKHTKVMNEELGNCKEDIKNLKDKPILKMSWKQIGAVIGGTATLVTIIYTIIKICLGITV